jgi:hypothetical protein
MDQQSTVRDIENRARRAYSSVRAVCLRAGVAPSTVARWKRTPRNPEPTSITLSTLDKVENALREIEAEARNEFSAPAKAVAA